MYPSALKTASNYGAMSGLASFAFFLLIYWSGSNPLGPVSWLGAWIPVVFMIPSVKKYRDRDCGGYVTYWPAYRASFLTAAFGALLFAALLWLFGTVIDSTILDKFREESLAYLTQNEEMSRSLFGESFYETSVENIQKITLGNIATQDFIYKCFGGMMVSFIIAAVMYRKPPAIQA